MPVSFVDPPIANSGRNSPKPEPTKIWTLREPPFEGFKPIDTEGYAKSNPSTAIVIDNGSSTVRAGWSFDSKPRISLPPLMARYRDRKLARSFMFVGSDIYSDGTARGQSKNVYEPGNNIINNWDVMEGVLDYVFVKLGVDKGYGSIGRPIVMTEPVANLGYTRKTMSEILFECYQAPSVAYGIDSLFSYKYNGGRTGLVASSSYTSTHLIPVINSKALLSQSTRLNWGRFQSAEFLHSLLKLKYPMFPGKTGKILSDPQAEDLVREHCYVSRDYQQELSSYLEWTGLEERSHIVQSPYTEQVVVQKTEEELARAAEKRKESGRRLQEQAAKMRLDKLIQKEQGLEYYKDFQVRLADMNKKDAKRELESEDFADQGQLEKKIREMEKSIRKARNKDLGEPEEEEVAEVPTFPLLDTPDDQLDEEGIKQKRQQKLMKSNYDARQRAKAEKEREKVRLAEDERLDTVKREADLESWLEERRIARNEVIQKIKDRDRLKADLGNRKSKASMQRMKDIARLADDNPTKKRRRGGDEDTFGADDADWTIYRNIAVGDQSDDEEEEDLNGQLKKLEEVLLQYDPDFTEESTREAQLDWTKSLVHAFQRGPYPHDPESQREAHQIHLNVERIRVPEVVFEPSIAGLDQAGIVEIAAGILNERLADSVHRDDILKDIFLTGGNTMFEGFEERLQKELMAILPQGAPLMVRRAKDPVLDAWRGAAQWAGEAGSKQHFVTRAEFLEKGADYIKEHDYGNSVL
ncbi:actin-like ATPase domain-containing protein [Tothia fuscella]|uniref:Actin-like ATPase domain-containing protein n=1 Tax=Tothia fuscella TaxID=1048955 RepID=A0A9P4NWA7_9PEZI|nr:actin-like ATPase domain-containing protein [Tothia fuscella]